MITDLHDDFIISERRTKQLETENTELVRELDKTRQQLKQAQKLQPTTVSSIVGEYDRITLEIWELIKTLTQIYPSKKTKEAREVIEDVAKILHGIRKSNERDLKELSIKE